MSRTPSAALIIVAALFLAPRVAVGKAPPCLTGASAATDLSQIAVVRADIDAACPCASYDGSKGKTHAKYVSCASGVIGAQVSAGNLRTQCKATVKKDYSVSTCGVPASKGDVPCIMTSATGKVTCAIKASSKCSGTACPGFSTCIAAADTNGDGIIGVGDTGACAPTNTPTPASTPTPTPTPTFTATFTPRPPPPHFVDNGDGTITDNQTGLMWEKQDQAGGLHDVNRNLEWSGLCSDNSASCQPDAAAASTCNAATGGAASCGQCVGAGVSCMTSTQTIWQWLNQLNTGNFAGHSDWRIPAAAELASILAAPYPCTGLSNPCVSAAFNNNCSGGCSVTNCSCTATPWYWSATPDSTGPAGTVLSIVSFSDANMGTAHSYFDYPYVRAVR